MCVCGTRGSARHGCDLIVRYVPKSCHLAGSSLVAIATMASLLYTVALGLLLVAATQSAPLAPMCAGYLGPDGEVAVRSSAASTSLCGASVPTNPAQFAAINLTYQAELHGGSANGVKGQNGWINIPLNQTSDVTIMVVDGFTPSCPPHTVNSTKPFEDTSYTTPYATASDKGAVLTLHLTEQFPCVPTFHFLLNGTTWYAKGDCGSGGIAVSWGTLCTLCSECPLRPPFPVRLSAGASVASSALAD